MKIALAQINTTVGDLAGNVERCLDAIIEGERQGADLVVLPEMAIPGYPPRDILLDTSFIRAVGEATQDLARRAAGRPPALVGTVVPSGTTTVKHPGLHNVAALLQGGDVTVAATKRLLPAYDVFLEPRWFIPGPASHPLDIAGRTIGVLICEDMWDESYPIHPGSELIATGADLLVALAAVPYRPGIAAERLYHARRHACPLVHVNLCGADDELIFDGSSFAVNAGGELVAQLPGFEEAVQVVDLDAAPAPASDPMPLQEELYNALTLGIRDFCRKNGVRRVFLGLSGGIDSAVVAILAAQALGPANVTAVAIPSRYSDTRSTESAEALARALGINFEVVQLEPLHTAVESTLGELLTVTAAPTEKPSTAETAAENAQARLRMLILMTYVNRYGGMLLNTSNKTELALGYGTLYGDLAGTLSPIGDLTKPQVYDLARWIQETRGIIPEFILERPPSAELKPDQVDPFDYPEVAPALDRLVRANRSNAALRRSEHKRRHHGVILKVSEKAFGSGRLIPVTRR